MGLEHDLSRGAGMTRRQRFRAAYGAEPLHLLALVASFAIAGAAVVGWFQRPRDLDSVLEWFAAAIVVHDLVLLPLYSLLDRIAVWILRRRTGQPHRERRAGRVDPTAYLRIPAILSALLFAVFFPVIVGLGSATELSASGIAERGYLTRWLLATSVMFTVSGLSYAVAVARATPPAAVTATAPDAAAAREPAPPAGPASPPGSPSPPPS
jgi:hypothetical protein